MNAPSLGDAWVKGEPGMTRRPKKGDFYVLWSTKPTADGGVQPKSFSHVAYFTGRSVNGDGTETWTSVDGGQGVAADYSPKGKLISKGAEAILACTPRLRPRRPTSSAAAWPTRPPARARVRLGRRGARRRRATGGLPLLI